MYVKWKGYDNLLNSWIDKKTLYKNESIIPKLFRSFGKNIKIKVDLSNYTTNIYLKSITHVDILSFALNTNLASLKTMLKN